MTLCTPSIPVYLQLVEPYEWSVVIVNICYKTYLNIFYFLYFDKLILYQLIKHFTFVFHAFCFTLLYNKSKKMSLKMKSLIWT